MNLIRLISLKDLNGDFDHFNEIEMSFLLYFKNSKQYYIGNILIVVNINNKKIFEYDSPENTFTISDDIWYEFSKKHNLTYYGTKMFIENFLILILNFKQNINIIVGSIY